MTTKAEIGHLIEVQNYRNMTEQEAVTLMTVFEKALQNIASTPVKWAKLSIAHLMPAADIHLGDFELEIERVDVTCTIEEKYFDLHSEWQGLFSRGNQTLSIAGTVDSV